MLRERALSFDFPVDFISEGMANIVVPNLSAFKRGPWDYAPSKAPVFYNPLMKPCRDIAVLVLQSYQENVDRELNVSEPLAGCGVRGIRFAKEVRGVNTVYLNDINERAYRMAKYNVQLNNLDEKVFVSNEDACLFLSRHGAPAQRFDFIDIDPFGSPVPYIGSAIRALRDRGLLALTATDLASLCGVYPRVALRKYGGLSLKTEYAHEIAVRLLAGSLANIAAKHDIGVRILFSHVAKHYVRLYALIEYGARKADRSLDNIGYLLHCFKCFHREAVEGILSLNSSSRCPECNSPLKVAGPLWLKEIVDREFCTIIERNMSSVKHINNEIIRLISLIKEEADAPITYYVIDKICAKIKAPTPSISEVINNIRDMSFRASRTHFHNKGIKTDAPSPIVIEAVKKAVKSGIHN